MKFLVVEDEMIIALDLVAHNEKIGLECVGIATNLVQANQLMTNDVKIVFMDINLKCKEDGFKVAEILRENFNFYLVFISASKYQIMVKNVEAFNNCEFVKKPFNSRNILQAIENAKKLY